MSCLKYDAIAKHPDPQRHWPLSQGGGHLARDLGRVDCVVGGLVSRPLDHRAVDVGHLARRLGIHDGQTVKLHANPFLDALAIRPLGGGNCLGPDRLGAV